MRADSTSLLSFALWVLFAGGPAGSAPFDPDLRHRPRLMLVADQLPLVQERSARAPYDAWMSNLRSRSNTAPLPYDDYDPSREVSNGNIAKAAAFTALVDADPDAAARALDVLLQCEDSVPNLTLRPLLIGEDIHLAEGLMLYVQAADLLFGSALLPPADSSAVHERLAALTRSTYRRYVKDNPLQYHLIMNNHRSKLAAAVGMAGLGLNQDDDASLWVDWGMTVVDEILRHQCVEQDGTYGEGPDYLSYSAVNHLPFAYAYHLFRDGVGGVFTYRRYGIFGQIVFQEDRQIDNPMTSDLYAALDDWGVAVRRFDGCRSPFDDANPVGYFSFFGAQVRDDPILAWDWWDADTRRLEDVADLRADAICVADDQQTRAQPSAAPTIFLPEGGHAILRQGWDRDDLRLHLLAEHDDARTAGGLHEHADATSFMIEAHGEPLALDSGYGRWEDRLLVNAAENHNLILVDGKGPPSPELIPPVGVDAAQGLEVDTERLDAVQATTHYRNADIRRTVATIDDSWVALLDHVVPEQGSHDFEWLLHGNAGGSAGGAFELSGDGARWERAGGSLVAHLASGGGTLQIDSEEMPHGLAWGSMESHMTLRATASGTQALFATLLELPAAGAGEALVSDLSRPGAALLLCLFEDGSRALLSSRSDSAPLTLGPLRYDGLLGIFVEGEPGSPAALLVGSCSEVRFRGQPVLAAEGAVDLAASWAGEQTQVHVEGGQGLRIELVVGCEVDSIEGPVGPWSNLPGGRVAFEPSAAVADLVFYCAS